MEDNKLKCVYESGNTMQVKFVQSILENYNIESAIQGDIVPDMIGWGRIGTGFNVITGPVKLMVNECDAEEATRIIEKNIDFEDAPEILEEEWSQEEDVSK